MKTQHMLKLVLIPVVVGLFSCNPYEVGDVTNYWNSNTLQRLQLKGSVKKVISFDGKQIDEYNTDGNVVLQTYSDAISGIQSTTTYNYNSGRLASIEFESTGGKGIQYTTEFEYQTIDKFVVVDKYSLLNDALAPNLKSKHNVNERTDYTMEGNLLKIIQQNLTDTYSDTTFVEYTGMYPTLINCGDGLVFNNFVYDSKGKFVRYNRVQTNETYTSTSEYFFHSHDQYLMLDSIVNTDVQGANTHVYGNKYEYNSNDDVSYMKDNFGEYEFTYVYDSHNNWISKSTKYRSISTVEWGAATVITREITYY